VEAGDERDDATDAEDEEKTDFVQKPFNRLVKRGGVSGESQRDLQAGEVVEVPKSAEDTARIETILATQTIFKHVAADQRLLLARAMTILDHEPGFEIISQGAAGDYFYALDSGEVECFVAPNDDLGKRALVKTYIAGETFGELALMYNAPCVGPPPCVSAWIMTRGRRANHRSRRPRSPLVGARRRAWRHRRAASLRWTGRRLRWC
jgi:cAMP-dependent protein kinase regulator